ncbi:hypothetical protein KFE98_06540 [bacterium SCSIO 12741]|nr:hypothetical protein KFE98_06540 [bacterium SCSIO 12741]
MKYFPVLLSLLLALSSHSYSQESNSELIAGWKVFTDTAMGYSIEYPAKWTASSAKGGFICGQESGFRNAEWTMWLSHTDNKERLDFVFNDEGLYPEYDIEKKSVTINGIKGDHTTITHPDNREEYIEIVVLKTDDYWYKFVNDAIKDERFQHFYSSFKLLD